MLMRLHRWLGVGLFGLMLSWFGSGLVMLFARYPHLPEAERLARLSPLASEGLPAPAVLADLPAVQRPDLAGGIRLRHDGLGAHFLFTALDGRSVRASAQTPPQVPVRLPKAALLQLARPHLAPDQTIVEAEFVEGDQWTMSAFYGRHHPLLRVRSGRDVVVYVAAATGEVVQRTTARARLLAWLGAIPHWWYLRLLRERAALWEGAVATGASALLVLCVLGLWLGVSRLGRAGRLSGHALLGLVFGVLACTWTLSGALSVNPFGLLPGPWSVADINRCLRGQPLPVTRYTRPLADAIAACRVLLPAVKQMELLQLAGEPFYLCAGEDGARAVTQADRAQAPATPHFDAQGLRKALACGPDLAVDRGSLVLADAPDELHHGDFRGGAFVTPYGRVQLTGPRPGTAYIDVHAGRAFAFYDRAGLRYRQLFSALHTWDVPWFRRHPRLRITLMVVALSGGVLLGLSGARLVLGCILRAW